MDRDTRSGDFTNFTVGELQVGIYDMGTDHVSILAISDVRSDDRVEVEWGYSDKHGTIRGSQAKGYYHLGDSFLYGRLLPYVIEELPV